MSRDAGFPIGDRSTRTLHDIRLIRAIRAAGLGALAAWDAVLDASWAAGERVPLEDAVDALAFDIGDLEPIRAALVKHGLLEEDGLIRSSSWEAWFTVAAERRKAARMKSALGGLRARGARSPEEALSLLLQRTDSGLTAGSTAEVTPPTVPTVPTVPIARETGRKRPPKRNGGEPVPVGSLLAKINAVDPEWKPPGFNPVPKPSPRKSSRRPRP
jgi:hypothetical protein